MSGTGGAGYLDVCRSFTRRLMAISLHIVSSSSSDLQNCVQFCSMWNLSSETFRPQIESHSCLPPMGTGELLGRSRDRHASRLHRSPLSKCSCVLSRVSHAPLAVCRRQESRRGLRGNSLVLVQTFVDLVSTNSSSPHGIRRK
jgi:hypothetical protein